jgi:hypothetical protein
MEGSKAGRGKEEMETEEDEKDEGCLERKVNDRGKKEKNIESKIKNMRGEEDRKEKSKI